MNNDLISRHAAIDALEKEKYTPFVNKDGSIDPFGAGRQKQWYRDSIAIMNLPPAQQWIPVSERLPEEDGSYLVFGECEPAFFISNFDAGCEAFGEWVDKYDLGTAKYVGPAFYKQNYVLAWMPLPENYKEV